MAGCPALQRRRRILHVSTSVILRRRDTGQDGDGEILETMLRRMRETLARVAPECWSGPEDGTLAGNLDCTDGIEVSVHMESHGLHLDVCQLNDPDMPERGGMLGVVVDRRMGVDRFMHVDAVTAHALAIDVVEGWIAELAESMRTDLPALNLGGSMDHADAAATMFRTLAASTGLKDDDYLLRIANPTPHSPAWISAEDRDGGQWTLDAPSLATCLKDMCEFSILTLQTRNPPILEIFAKTWMPDVEERPDPITIMRTMEAAGVRHVVRVVPE